MNGENTLKARNLWAEDEDRILRSEVVKQGTMICSETVAPLSWLEQEHRVDMVDCHYGPTASNLGKPRDWRAIAEKLPGRSNKGATPFFFFYLFLHLDTCSDGWGVKIVGSGGSSWIVRSTWVFRVKRRTSDYMRLLQSILPCQSLFLLHLE